MTVIELDSIIAPFFISYIGEDFVENLSREYYRGLAVMSDDDGEMAAGII